MKKLVLAFILLCFSPNAWASNQPSLQLPAGMVFAFAGSTCPVGTVAADGSSLLRAGRYASLFTAIGTAHGTADITHFNVPDLRGKFIRGVDGTASNDPDHASRTACATGGATGNAVGSCQVDQVIAHDHSIPWYLREQISAPGGTLGWDLDVVGGPPDFTGSNTATTNYGGSETRPKNVVLTYCVKY